MRNLINVVLLIMVQTVISLDLRLDPLVMIDQGLVRGKISSGGQYATFYGIPYAEVDTGNPFGPTLLAPEFEGIFNAYDSVACPQLLSTNGTYFGIIDCLRVNIYAPAEASTQKPAPVLVWIHGGGFEMGESYAAESFEEITKQGIVVVTVTYRLDIYGFICLDSPSAPGNQGLKDQQTALRWVRNNIAAFGGNPQDVTIGGESAGGASVNFHLYASGEKLFNKAIIMSLTAQSIGAHYSGDLFAAQKIAQHLGYNTTDTDAALTFISSVEPRLVLAASKELNMKFRPCKELSYSGVESFIDTMPYSLYNQDKVKGTPILIGSASKEGPPMLQTEGDFYYMDTFEGVIAKYFVLNEVQLAKAAALIRHFYIGDSSVDDVSVTSQLYDFVSDFFFNHALFREVEKLAQQNAVIYNYIFDYPNGEATHMSEMPYILQSRTDLFNDEETKISLRMTTMWTNFIKEGKPTLEVDDTVPVKWPQVTPGEQPFLRIDAELHTENRFRQQSMAFWDLFYNSYEQYYNLARNC